MASEPWCPICGAVSDILDHECPPSTVELKGLASFFGVDPFHEITPDMPEDMRRNFQAINEGIAEGIASWRPPEVA